MLPTAVGLPPRQPRPNRVPHRRRDTEGRRNTEGGCPPLQGHPPAVIRHRPPERVGACCADMFHAGSGASCTRCAHRTRRAGSARAVRGSQGEQPRDGQQRRNGVDTRTATAPTGANGAPSAAAGCHPRSVPCAHPPGGRPVDRLYIALALIAVTTLATSILIPALSAFDRRNER